jgi:hypothetical protein
MEHLLGNLNNMLGPIGQDVGTRILALLRDPNINTWEDAHCILIQSNLTIWQAVIAVDSTFPKTGRTTNTAGDTLEEWARVPDQVTLVRAVKYARERRAA